MLDIELNDIINILGQPTRKAGHQYYFRCPACKNRGGDKSGDNLLFNSNKGLLKCFACDDGAREVLRLINQNKNRGKTTDTNHQVVSQRIGESQSQYFFVKNADNLIKYWEESINELLQYRDYCKELYLRHSIESDIACDLGVGLDLNPNFPNLGPSIGPCFIFPMIMPRYGTITGFELRQIGDKKLIRRSPAIPNGLCKVWGLDRFIDDVKHAIVVEGFKDACNLYSLLKRGGKKLYEWFIYTCPHGVGSLPQCISDIDWLQFNGCYLILDNDQAGDSATDKIIQNYPFFKDKRNLLKGYKDITDYKSFYTGDVS